MAYLNILNMDSSIWSQSQIWIKTKLVLNYSKGIDNEEITKPKPISNQNFYHTYNQTKQ